MLAPLENRAIVKRQSATEDKNDNRRSAPNIRLQQALQQARRQRKRLLARHAAQLARHAKHIGVLEAENRNLRSRLDKLESGQAVIELGQQLMAAREANRQLMSAAHRVWQLDRTLCAAHRECERIACERDRLALRLDQLDQKR